MRAARNLQSARLHCRLRQQRAVAAAARDARLRALELNNVCASEARPSPPARRFGVSPCGGLHS